MNKMNTINPNITVEEVEYSALDDWVAARSEQQQLEAQAKTIKKETEVLFEKAQAEALGYLAKANGLVDVDPEAYPSTLADAKIKTFQFNSLFKVQVSFTTVLQDNEELTQLTESLKAEQSTLEKANEAEINVLLAERALLGIKIAALRTSSKATELSQKVSELRGSLTFPAVKSMALKKVKP